jgi:hypothetical protein
LHVVCDSLWKAFGIGYFLYITKLSLVFLLDDFGVAV